MIERLIQKLFCRLGWHDWDRVMTDEGEKKFCRECGTPS